MSEQRTPRPPIASSIDLTPVEQAEAALAHALRQRGLPRIRAMLLAEGHSSRFTFDPDGALRVRLADGTVALGDGGIQLLAAELSPGVT